MQEDGEEEEAQMILRNNNKREIREIKGEMEEEEATEDRIITNSKEDKPITMIK
jgi:hypothetical protein